MVLLSAKRSVVAVTSGLLIASATACSGSGRTLPIGFGDFFPADEADSGAPSMDASSVPPDPMTGGMDPDAGGADASMGDPNPGDDAGGGGPDDAGSDASDANDEAGTTYQGYVSLWSDRPTKNDQGWHIFDTFFAIIPPQTQSAQCVHYHFGPCDVAECDQSSGAPGSGGTAPTIDAGTLSGNYTSVNAGTVELTGGYLTEATKLTQIPMGTGGYGFVNGPGLIWAPTGGATMSITALGGTVPPFASTIVAPALIVLSSPVMMEVNIPGSGTDELVTYSGDPGLDLAWTGGTAQHQVLFEASAATQTSVKLTSLECTFTGDQGTGGQAQIPAQAMAMLRDAAPGSMGLKVASAQVYSINQKNITAGQYAIAVQAQAYGQAPTQFGSAYSQFDIVFTD